MYAECPVGIDILRFDTLTSLPELIETVPKLVAEKFTTVVSGGSTALTTPGVKKAARKSNATIDAFRLTLIFVFYFTSS